MHFYGCSWKLIEIPWKKCGANDKTVVKNFTEDIRLRIPFYRLIIQEEAKIFRILPQTSLMNMY